MFRRCLHALIFIGLTSLLPASAPSYAQTTVPAAPPPKSDPAVGTPRRTFTTNLVETAPTPHERWDSLTLEGSGLELHSAILGEKDEFPDFTRELWRVEWRDGDPIDLYVIRPIATRKTPVILFLYGYPASTDRFRNDAYCRSVTKGGVAAVGFVSALTGPRYHDRPWKEWFVGNLQESLVTSVHDVQMVLNYLATRDDLDMQHVGMFGQGSGGTIALLASAVDPRLKAVDVLDPWGDWPEWFKQSSLIAEQERAQYLTPAFQAGIANLDPLRWLPRDTRGPLRLQSTAFDRITPELAKSSIERALPPGAEHVTYDSVANYQERAAAGGQVLSWLRNQLAPQGPVGIQPQAGR